MENYAYASLANDLKKLLNLDSSPVAIAFTSEIPEGIGQFKGELRLCQMLDNVRLDNEIFYTTVDNHKCDGGSGSCGMKKMGDKIKNGEFLHKMGLFGSNRAARRFINSISRIETGTVSIVSFSPLEKATFEPDVVVIICNAKQGMIISEAFAFESGKRTLGMTGPPICSSIVAAPFLLGEVTYSFGDHGARNNMRLTDNDVFVGIPGELLNLIAGNLGKMKL